jgi:2-polyprenyl-6-hydroxyphenyl methylase / 3-demethylubiquinone-9 3-methyltransferase
VEAAYKGARRMGQRHGRRRKGAERVAMSVRPSPSIKSEEVARFEALGDAWWDPDGPMAPLHRVNPIRIGWARDLIVRHFKLETPVGLALAGVDLLDVGCGAGLFAEPLARLGANVIGVDPSPSAIAAARGHAEETGARLAYRASTVEELAAESRRFDIVCAMEVIEHTANPKRFFATAASLVKPGGLFLASTLNRTLRSFALAIVGAEYVLRWLEPGTHRWEQFVTPLELTSFAHAAGLRRVSLRGMAYDPFRRDWRLSSDTAVNYLFAATKPEA